MSAEERIEEAVGVACRYGSIDGDHHKAWVIDQMVRILLGSGYGDWRHEYEADGEYEWSEGVPP